MAVGLRNAAPRMPAWFISHGGGPMPLLGDVNHSQLIDHWKTLAATLPAKPRAILLISGHWEEKTPTVNTSAAPGVLYDYYGFPPEAYKIRYDAPGDPALAKDIVSLLRNAGWQAAEEPSRGLDHGAFVPLKVIFPAADIPVVMLSLLKSLDPKKHIELGEAVAHLRDEGVLVIGSGSSYHRMQGFDWGGGEPSSESKAFNTWLQEALTGAHPPEDRKRLLQNWEKAPFGRFCHPREEHLLPVHVALGAGRGDKARVIFEGPFLGTLVSAFEWK